MSRNSEGEDLRSNGDVEEEEALYSTPFGDHVGHNIVPTGDNISLTTGMMNCMILTITSVTKLVCNLMQVPVKHVGKSTLQVAWKQEVIIVRENDPEDGSGFKSSCAAAKL